MRLVVLLLLAGGLFAADDFTVYELLAPASHSFNTISDVTLTREGSEYFYNPVRPGSVTNERAIDLATGKALQLSVIDGKPAIKLLKSVPKGAETRIRIYKTYTAPPSYFEKDDGFVFDQPLGNKRNVVVLPKGYELVGSASPAIVSTDADGRIRMSFLNDRDDQLPARIIGRKLK
jgi:hypothetical protein